MLRLRKGFTFIALLTRFWSAGAVVLSLAACHNGMPDGPGNNCINGVCPYTDTPAPAGGVAQFTVLPTAPVPGLSLTAMGSLNPPGHTLPTDHVYLYSWDLSQRNAVAQPGTRNVYMPATGALFLYLSPDGRGDSKVMFRATENFYFYLDHVLLTIPMYVDSVYKAGTLIGTTQPAATLDLGAFDASVTNSGFLTPGRYAYQTLHAVSPWKYFTPALQAQLYPQVYRAPSAPDKDGKIDFDIAGKLSGSWYVEAMPVDSSSEPYGWTRTVSFVNDFYDPTQVRISIGGTIGAAGVWAIAPTAPRPETVTTANGLVSYDLYSQFDPLPPFGRLLVQMISDTQIKIELFLGSNPTATQFDANAYIFVR